MGEFSISKVESPIPGSELIEVNIVLSTKGKTRKQVEADLEKTCAEVGSTSLSNFIK